MLKAVLLLTVVGVCVATDPFAVTGKHISDTRVELTVATDSTNFSVVGFSTTDPAPDAPEYIVRCKASTPCIAQEYDSAGACGADISSDDINNISNTATLATFTIPNSVMPKTGDVALYMFEKAVSGYACATDWGWEKKDKFLLAPIPSFDLTITRTKDTTLETTIVPGDNQTVFFGWRKEVTSLYPTDAIICAPSVTTITKCLDAKCTDASSCEARTTTIYTENTSKDGTAKVTRTLTAGDVKLSADEKMYLAWDIKQPASAPTSLDVTKLHSRMTWKYYSIAVPAVPTTTEPDNKKITITRPGDTTLETTIVPGDNQTVFFGWRKFVTSLYPTDAIICAPSVTTITKCLDAKCTDASSCEARTTTIYTENTSKDGTAKVTRTLTAGDVKLSADETMYLAWDIIKADSDPTSHAATDLHSRTTWKYYSIAVPAKSSAQTIVPSIMAVALALLYVIA